MLYKNKSSFLSLIINFDSFLQTSSQMLWSPAAALKLTHFLLLCSTAPTAARRALRSAAKPTFALILFFIVFKNCERFIFQARKIQSGRRWWRRRKGMWRISGKKEGGGGGVVTRRMLQLVGFWAGFHSNMQKKNLDSVSVPYRCLEQRNLFILVWRYF